MHKMIITAVMMLLIIKNSGVKSVGYHGLESFYKSFTIFLFLNTP